MAMQYFTVVSGDGGVGGNEAVMVPLNRKTLAAVSRERMRNLRKHIVASMRAMRGMKDPIGSATPQRPEPEGFAGQVARSACALCRGFCCKGGEEHAYLDERTLARVRLARPELDARAVLRLYAERVPAVGYADSCVFHAADGCTLDRALRSDVCNSYFCTGLGNFVKASRSPAGVVVMAGQDGEMHMSPVLTP